MPVLSNAELASAVQQVVARVDAREDQLRAWQSGTADGGPFADGRYAIDNLVGETSYFKSPARLEYEITYLTAAGTGAVDAAGAARDAAEAALASALVEAQAAASSASTASTKASEALVYRNDAASSEANALVYRDQAQTAATTATAAATSASSDAADAAASAAYAATFGPQAGLIIDGGDVNGTPTPLIIINGGAP